MMTKNTAPTEFDVLYNFFIPLGPMFQLIYRLLNDSLKYEVPLTNLPIKMQQMIEGGRYSTFYPEIIHIDPFRRQIVSLYLNSFDYFMLHFAIHGMVPLHNSFPAAMAISTEKWKSPYFFLTADYLCCFLPSNPHQPVMPQNICKKTVKSMPSPAIQQIQ
jgi:sphingomyelin phosphodiesterase 4